jgi:hypothetical protein
MVYLMIASIGCWITVVILVLIHVKKTRLLGRVMFIRSKTFVLIYQEAMVKHNNLMDRSQSDGSNKFLTYQL